MRKILRFIWKYSPLPGLLQKSKKWIMPGTDGLCVYDILHRFRKQLNWQGLLERAAAISYNVIMALPPSLLFLFTLIPVLPFFPKDSMKTQLHELIYDIIPAKVHNMDIINFVDKLIDATKVGLISFGFLLTLFFASNAVMGVMRSFNRDYTGFEERKGLIKRWMAIKITAILFSLLIIYFLMLIMQGKFLDMIVQNDILKTVIFYSRWFFIIVLVFFSIGFVFKYAPSTSKRWGLISPGSVLATILSLFSSLGFSLFVNNFGRYNALYGALGTVMMIMALVFINSLALLIGFELNVGIIYLTKHTEKRRAEIKLESQRKE